MADSIVMVGIGQMGSVFSHALLRAGHPITPVNRGDSIAEAVEKTQPQLILVTVGESELPDVLGQIPPDHRNRVALLQNELLPAIWKAGQIEDPTVAVVWFEKKANIVPHVIQSTPIAGPQASILVNALEGIGLTAHTIDDDNLLQALVAKNVYILTANLGGLAVGGGTVRELWSQHHSTAESIARDAIALQQAMCKQDINTDATLTALQQAFEADPNHNAMGRSAPARLARAKSIAKELGLELAAFEDINVST